MDAAPQQAQHTGQEATHDPGSGGLSQGSDLQNVGRFNPAMLVSPVPRGLPAHAQQAQHDRRHDRCQQAGGIKLEQPVVAFPAVPRAPLQDVRNAAAQQIPNSFQFSHQQRGQKAGRLSVDAQAAIPGSKGGSDQGHKEGSSGVAAGAAAAQPWGALLGFLSQQQPSQTNARYM